MKNNLSRLDFLPIDESSSLSSSDTKFKMTPLQPTMRKATPQDAEQIAIIHVSSWQKMYKDFIPESLLKEISVIERQRQWLSLIHKGVTVLVVEFNEELIGFASVCAFRQDIHKSWGEISAIYLAPPYWRQGFGRQLCEAALAELARLNYERVGLWVFEANIQAQAFYESLGFTATGDSKLNEFYEGGALLKEILYQKSLQTNL